MKIEFLVVLVIKKDVVQHTAGKGDHILQGKIQKLCNAQVGLLQQLHMFFPDAQIFGKLLIVTQFFRDIPSSCIQPVAWYARTD